MDSKKKKFIAASVAGLLAVSGVLAATESAYAFWPFKKHHDANSCSGKNSSSSKANSCAGKNSCSGKAGK